MSETRHAHCEALFLVALLVATLLVIGFFIGLARAYRDGALGQLEARAVPTAKVKRVVWSPQRRMR